jgi:hypothetical protein
MNKQTEAMKLVLEALVPFEQLFMQADEKGLLGGQNIDCQIAAKDLRKLVYATADLRKALKAPAEQQAQTATYTCGVCGVSMQMEQLSPLEQPAQQEPVALFKWLPEGATHIGRISVRTAAGGSLAMTTHAFKYDSAVLKVYFTDNDNEYPGWRDAKDCFFHLNFPVLPLYTSPPAQRPWVGLTHEEVEEVWKRVEASDFRDVVHPFAQAIEAALRSKNENRN